MLSVFFNFYIKLF